MSDTVTRGPQYPLTWLRGLAAVCVVTFHAYQHDRSGPDAAWPWSGLAHRLMLGSDAFVDLFFVLSGLVLWLPVSRAALRGETDRPGRVVLYRRMARLLPLYYLVVLAVWALSNPVFPGEHWGDLVLHLTFLHVWSDQYVFWTDGPAWSLGVEFHFYVLMALAVPLVHAAVRRTTSRARRLLAVGVLPALLVALGLGYLLWATVLQPQAEEHWAVWYSPPSRAADFGIGMVVAMLAAGGVRLPRAARATSALVGVAGLLVLVVVRPETGVLTQWWHPLYSLAIGVALLSVVLHDGPWPAVLSRPAVVWVGSLGYGVYLIHEPVMRVLDAAGVLPAAQQGSRFLVTAVIVLVPTLALAWLSAHTVERAGQLVVSTIDRQGRSRDYYAHLSDDERAVTGAGARP